MLWLTMVLSAAGGPLNVVDPCHPPVPCMESSNMSDPLGDCSVYYVCQPGHLLWQRMHCEETENNETTQYDLVTGLCLGSSLQPTCHDRCPGASTAV